MNETWLNGRRALDWEIPIIRHARQCELDRDITQLAGLMFPRDERHVTAPVKPARPVTDLSMEWLAQ